MRLECLAAVLCIQSRHKDMVTSESRLQPSSQSEEKAEERKLIFAIMQNSFEISILLCLLVLDLFLFGACQSRICLGSTDQGDVNTIRLPGRWYMFVLPV